MAGDWIHMRVSLKKDPKVILLADRLAEEDRFQTWLTLPVGLSCESNAYSHVTRNVMRALCVTALLEVWGFAREHGTRIGDDLRVTPCTLEILDDICDVPCFGTCMAAVGWAKENQDSSVWFPKFFRIKESPSQRHRSQNAERQARFRQKHGVTNNDDGNVTNNAISNATSNVTITHRREEKRREEELRQTSSAEDVSTEPKTGSVVMPFDAIDQGKPGEEKTETDTLLYFPCAGKKDSWALKQPLVEELSQAFPAVDVLAEAKKALSWIGANPSKKKTFNGMRRFLHGWMSRVQDRGGTRCGPAMPSPNGPMPSNPFGSRLEGVEERISARMKGGP